MGPTTQKVSRSWRGTWWWRWAALLPLGLLLWGAPATVKADPGPATDQVRATVDEVLRILKAPEYQGPARADARYRAIRSAITERFGFSEMARRSLGVNWAARSPSERTEFVRLYTDLLERSYLNRIESYTDEKIVYLDETVDGDNAEVRSRSSPTAATRCQSPTACCARATTGRSTTSSSKASAW